MGTATVPNTAVALAKDVTRNSAPKVREHPRATLAEHKRG